MISSNQFQMVLSAFGDQAANGQEVEDQGTGLHIPFKSMNEENLYESVKAILDDEKYLHGTQALGSILVEQETSPLDRALWWIEFIIRHPDFKLKRPYQDLSWIEANLLDVYAFLLAVIILQLLVIICTCKCICSCCCKRKQHKNKTD